MSEQDRRDADLTGPGPTPRPHRGRGLRNMAGGSWRFACATCPIPRPHACDLGKALTAARRVQRQG